MLAQDRSVAQKPHWGFHCCATAAFCFPKKQKIRTLLLLRKGSDFHYLVHLSSSPESLLFLRISRLLEDTDGRLPRSELARLLNYNGSYLNSIVQRRTGLCLFDYGMTFCFQKAERLLRETTLSVSEIALQLKFTNRTHFYELFRQKYGMTPQQWRKMQKSAEHSE